MNKVNFFTYLFIIAKRIQTSFSLFFRICRTVSIISTKWRAGILKQIRNLEKKNKWKFGCILDITSVQHCTYFYDNVRALGK